MEAASEKIDTPLESVGAVKRKPLRKTAGQKQTGNIRQRTAIALIPKHNGNVGAAMREAGYPEASAKNPQRLTKSKAYADLIEQFLPDQMLLERHSEIINAPRIKRTYLKGLIMEETEETDPSQVRGLDMAYKLKGKYNDGTTTNVLIVQLSDTSADRYKPIQHDSHTSPADDS